VKINCAAVPENLLESEFFGYTRGAFTGALQDKPGRFEEADKGTIFLDEIGDLPLSLQAKLLRVLEDKEFYPLGSPKTRKVNVRIISATNRNLEKLVKDRQFREDLYYRLNVVRMELPTLTRRREDLPFLIRHILRKISAVHAMPPPPMSENTMQILLNYTYPGNVREMENIIEHAMILCRKGAIQAHHLPDYVRGLNASIQPLTISTSINKFAEEFERITTVLNACRGHRGKAARILDMNRTTLWRKMKRYGMLK
jgi:transcriptional regulator with PAS, ATPase and Fis domain